MTNYLLYNEGLINKSPIISNSSVPLLCYVMMQDTSNVMGVMVLNNEGFPIRSNLDNTSTVQYGHMIADICVKVNTITALSSSACCLLSAG